MTLNEFGDLTSRNCHYCGVEPRQVHKPKGSNGAYLYNGLDRLDNAVGYTVENCVPCCYTCNHAKGKMSVEAFKVWLNRLTAFHKVQNETSRSNTK